MINITLCLKDLGEEDMPQYKFEKSEDAIEAVYDWLVDKDMEKSVFVCFANWETNGGADCRNAQRGILVSHSWDHITDYVDVYSYCKALDLALFEFESYEKAFRYCIDLKEGF